MRIFGSLTNRQYEVHLTEDSADPPQVEVFWKDEKEGPQKIHHGYVALFTWAHIGGDAMPRWLLADLKRHEVYVTTQWSARFNE